MQWLSLSSLLAYFPSKVLAQLAKIFSQSDDVQKFWQFSMCFLIGPKIVTWVWSVRDSHCRRLPAVPAVSGGSGNLAERQRRAWSIFGCCFPPRQMSLLWREKCFKCQKVSMLALLMVNRVREVSVTLWCGGVFYKLTSNIYLFVQNFNLFLPGF